MEVHMRRNSRMHQASGMMGSIGSKKCKEKILLPYLACALVPDCIYPDDGTKIICKGDPMEGQPHRCHRYDQAEITIHRVL